MLVIASTHRARRWSTCVDVVSRRPALVPARMRRAYVVLAADAHYARSATSTDASEASRGADLDRLVALLPARAQALVLRRAGRLELLEKLLVAKRRPFAAADAYATSRRLLDAARTAMTHGDLSRAVRAAAAHVIESVRGATAGSKRRDGSAIALLKALVKRVRHEGAAALGVSEIERALLSVAYSIALGDVDELAAAASAFARAGCALGEVSDLRAQ
jgi:hypothetical protein